MFISSRPSNNNNVIVRIPDSNKVKNEVNKTGSDELTVTFTDFFVDICSAVTHFRQV